MSKQASKRDKLTGAHRRQTGRPIPRFNYELFNCNNLNIRYWSWNYRGCWHHTCPPMDPHKHMTTGRINQVAFINQGKTTSYSRKHMESGNRRRLDRHLLSGAKLA
ncbi:hypothetical protein YC2023_089207 [Brassica napus]